MSKSGPQSWTRAWFSHNGPWSRLMHRITSLPERVLRWAQMPDRPPARRRFVIIQIDGLSHAVLQQALERGMMPTLSRLLHRDDLKQFRMSVGLPTSTPAFQAGLMYGAPVNIPAFEFFDKCSGKYLWFPWPWVSAAVEAAHAQGRRGIMEGGRTYGCMFGGGATDTVFTFASLLRPSPAWVRRGVRATLVPLFLFSWLLLKMSAVTALEGLRWSGRVVANAFRRRHRGQRLLLMRLLLGTWLRDLFTHSLIADIYAGVPALYVNFVYYDVAAHAVGPDHPTAIRTLRLIDHSIRDIWRAIRQVPELGYDLFILSDHGMTPSIPFEKVNDGVPVVDVVLDIFQAAGQRPAASDEGEVSRRMRREWTSRWPLGRVWQQHLAYLEPRSREWNAVWAGNLCLVPAGPNLNLYLTHAQEHVPVEDIELLYPGALEKLSRHPGIGFLLARNFQGPVCYYRGSMFPIPPPPGPTGCPLFDRPDRAVVVQGLQGLLAMPSAGDVVVYGHYSPQGCISYLGERGSHAGPSEEEMYAFLFAPSHVAFDFGAVTRPQELYPFFMSYQDKNHGDRKLS